LAFVIRIYHDSRSSECQIGESSQIHVAATLSPGQKSQLHFKYEASWTPEPVGTFRWISHAISRSLNSKCPSVQPVSCSIYWPANTGNPIRAKI